MQKVSELIRPRRTGQPVNPCVHRAAKIRAPAWMLVLTFPLAACATPIVTAAPNSCATLLPSTWKQGVPGSDLPDGNTVGDWIVFGEAQTGRLEVANGRTKDAIEVIERCEARDAAAVKRATRSWLGRLFG